MADEYIITQEDLNQSNSYLRTLTTEHPVCRIADGVTSIGVGVFYKCAGLTSINIPDSVTSIGNHAFDKCTGLTSINIPDSVTSIGFNAFQECTALTSINIPNSVTSIDASAFYYCSSLTSINIPNSVTSIGGGAFGACSSLTSINIPNSVTSIGETAFYGCSSLTSINIPNSVTSIGDYAFNSCTNLTTVTLGSGLTTIGTIIFLNCTNLTTIYVPKGFDTSILEGNIPAGVQVEVIRYKTEDERLLVRGNERITRDLKVQGEIFADCGMNLDSICSTGSLAVNVNCGLNVTVGGNKTENITGNKTETVTNKTENITCAKTVNAPSVTTNGDTHVTNACCSITLNTPTTNVTGDLNVSCVTTTGDLCVTGKVKTGLDVDGDIRGHQDIIADCDLVVHGNLLVDGTTTSATETQVATTGDYIVTRENNNAALSSTDYSGIAVNNYTSGCMATLTADYCGEWRVSDSATNTSTVYTDVSGYNGQFYDHLTQTVTAGPTGVMTDVDAVELSNIALYNSNYYHLNGSDWYGPVTVVNGLFDLGSLITDSTVIAALEALTTYELVYYNSVKDNHITVSANQPLLTRDEIACLENNDILVWDATNKRAIHMPRPTVTGQALKATIDPNTSCVTYNWDTVPSSAAIDFIYPVGTIYQNATSNTNPGTLFGVGDWCPITDKFLMASGTTYTGTGGCNTVTLAVCHLPSHCHCVKGWSGTQCSATSSGSTTVWNGGCPYSGTCTSCGRANTGGASVEMCHRHSVTTKALTGGDCTFSYYASNTNQVTRYTDYVNLRHTHALCDHYHIMGTHYHYNNFNSQNTGSGCSFSIIPPYCAVYTWYRKS